MEQRFFINDRVARGRMCLKKLCESGELGQLSAVETAMGDVVVNGYEGDLDGILPNLGAIEGGLYMEGCPQTRLPGNLRCVKGSCHFRDSGITRGSLEGHGKLLVYGNIFVSPGSELLSRGLPGNVICHGKVSIDKSREQTSGFSGAADVPERKNPLEDYDPYSPDIGTTHAQ
ncbi:hypothetical protein IKF73_00120 [Candidatus Saccharibacteria bacterium]|nr:hypothetical protein [Candidatus Saccharibacteria bacterium]